MLSVFINCYLLCLLRQELSFEPRAFDSLVSQSTWGPLSLSMGAGTPGELLHLPSIYVCSGNQNSGPHAYTASALSTEVAC